MLRKFYLKYGNPFLPTMNKGLLIKIFSKIFSITKQIISTTFSKSPGDEAKHIQTKRHQKQQQQQYEVITITTTTPVRDTVAKPNSPTLLNISWHIKYLTIARPFFL